MILSVTVTALILRFLTAAVCALVKEEWPLLKPGLRAEIPSAAAVVVILPFSSAAAAPAATVAISAAAVAA